MFESYLDELRSRCEELRKALEDYRKYGDGANGKSSAQELKLMKAYEEARESYNVALAESY